MAHAMAGTGRPDGNLELSVHRREKRQAAKRLGRHHASSSEDDLDGMASDGEDSAGAGADGDPFFQREEDPFSDPFFQVSPASRPGLHPEEPPRLNRRLRSCPCQLCQLAGTASRGQC